MKSPGTTVTVNDTMQQGYSYQLVAPKGSDFDPRFVPQLTPQQMLELGVFGGKYMTDCAGAVSYTHLDVYKRQGGNLCKNQSAKNIDSKCYPFEKLIFPGQTVVERIVIIP